VELGVGGRAVPLTEAASFPTVMSMPHACGSVSVAEYTHVGFSLTPLMLVLAPQASVKRKVRLQVGETAASGPYSCVVYTPPDDSYVLKDPHGLPAF